MASQRMGNIEFNGQKLTFRYNPDTKTFDVKEISQQLEHSQVRELISAGKIQFDRPEYAHAAEKAINDTAAVKKELKVRKKKDILSTVVWAVLALGMVCILVIAGSFVQKNLKGAPVSNKPRNNGSSETTDKPEPVPSNITEAEVREFLARDYFTMQKDIKTMESYYEMQGMYSNVENAVTATSMASRNPQFIRDVRSDMGNIQKLKNSASTNSKPGASSAEGANAPGVTKDKEKSFYTRVIGSRDAGVERMNSVFGFFTSIFQKQPGQAGGGLNSTLQVEVLSSNNNVRLTTTVQDQKIEMIYVFKKVKNKWQLTECSPTELEKTFEQFYVMNNGFPTPDGVVYQYQK